MTFLQSFLLILCFYKKTNITFKYLDNSILITIFLKTRYYKCYYDKIDTSERIDPNRSNKSKESMICHYSFFNHGFNFQGPIWNGCHDLKMLSLNIRDISIINVKMLIVVVLFRTLANLKWLIYWKIMCLKVRDIYKNMSLIFSLFKASLSLLFCFGFAIVYIKWLIVNIVWTSINL